MIVVDASALLECLLQTSIGVRVEARLFRDEDELHAPHLVDVEVVRGLGRLVRMGEVFSGRAGEAIVDLADLDLHRHPHVDLLGRAWKLRDTISTTITSNVLSDALVFVRRQRTARELHSHRQAIRS